MIKQNLNKIFITKKLDVLISFAWQTRLWYAKVMTSDGILFIEKNSAILAVDNRYIEYAKETAENVKINLYDKNFLKNFSCQKQYKIIGIEKDYLTIEKLNVIKKMFPDTEIIEISGKELRIIKSHREIKNIKKACQITMKSLNSIKNLIRPGIKEVEIANYLNHKIKELGADKESFDTIVVSGERSSLPHGSPSHKKLKSGETVTIDCGVYYNGYASDITRTFKVGDIINQKLEDILSIVKLAQLKGIEAVKPGVKIKKIDQICRNYITEKGYGKYFLHATGHGLGIDVHELPTVSSNNNNVLEAGMVITIEPGIYIEEFGGVRFEDDILVTETGYEILSIK